MAPTRSNRHTAFTLSTRADTHTLTGSLERTRRGVTTRPVRVVCTVRPHAATPPRVHEGREPATAIRQAPRGSYRRCHVSEFKRGGSRITSAGGGPMGESESANRENPPGRGGRGRVQGLHSQPQGEGRQGRSVAVAASSSPRTLSCVYLPVVIQTDTVHRVEM